MAEAALQLRQAQLIEDKVAHRETRAALRRLEHGATGQLQTQLDALQQQHNTAVANHLAENQQLARSLASAEASALSANTSRQQLADELAASRSEQESHLQEIQRLHSELQGQHQLIDQLKHDHHHELDRLRLYEECNHCPAHLKTISLFDRERQQWLAEKAVLQKQMSEALAERDARIGMLSQAVKTLEQSIEMESAQRRAALAAGSADSSSWAALEAAFREQEKEWAVERVRLSIDLEAASEALEAGRVAEAAAKADAARCYSICCCHLN